MKKFNLFTITSITLIVMSCGTPSNQSNKEVAEEVSIIGETVNYQSPSTEMQGYITFDQAQEGKRPGIVVVHEWWGHNEYTRKKSRYVG